MRRRIQCVLILLLAGISSLNVAKGATTFKSVAWTPQELQSGSACLFSIQLEGSPAKISGKWMGHDMLFFQARGSHEWYGLAGVDVEALPGTYALDVVATMPDGEVVHLARDIQVGPSNYKTVSLRVPDRFVKPDAAALRQIESDKQAKKMAFSHQSPTPEWSGDFLAPAGSVVSDSFGTRRVFNGQLASIHRGLDFRVKSGSPVLAANSGEVVLAREMFYEGNCVIIDHGGQFMTLYMHLSRLEVAEGQKVTKGQEIGLSGATGRATGPHLHMGVRWEGAYIDPASLLNLTLNNLP
jgi:murein DD-endopeptidase MepM/ murein hydrolase activator NlpD